MSCGVGYTCGLDLVLLWLWCRLAATALIRPLAWKPPYASCAGLKRKEKKKERKKEKEKEKEGKKEGKMGVPVVAQWLTNLTGNNEVVGSIPGLAQWVKNPVFGVPVVAQQK